LYEATSSSKQLTVQHAAWLAVPMYCHVLPMYCQQQLTQPALQIGGNAFPCPACQRCLLPCAQTALVDAGKQVQLKLTSAQSSTSAYRSTTATANVAPAAQCGGASASCESCAGSSANTPRLPGTAVMRCCTCPLLFLFLLNPLILLFFPVMLCARVHHVACSSLTSPFPVLQHAAPCCVPLPPRLRWQTGCCFCCWWGRWCGAATRQWQLNLGNGNGTTDIT
jgi:hypothetical protein